MESTNSEEAICRLLSTCDRLSQWVFGAACCRRVWGLLTDERSRSALEVVEKYADNTATEAELNEAACVAKAVVDYWSERDGGGSHWDPNWSRWTAQDNAHEYGRLAVHALTTGNISEAARLSACASGAATEAASGHAANSREASSANGQGFRAEIERQYALLKDELGARTTDPENTQET